MGALAKQQSTVIAHTSNCPHKYLPTLEIYQGVVPHLVEGLSVQSERIGTRVFVEQQSQGSEWKLVIL
jgi:hypothetical protein